MRQQPDQIGATQRPLEVDPIRDDRAFDRRCERLARAVRARRLGLRGVRRWVLRRDADAARWLFLRRSPRA